MAAGMIVNEKSFSFKRPATGMNPFEYESLIGKVLKKSVFADEIVQISDFE